MATTSTQPITNDAPSALEPTSTTATHNADNAAHRLAEAIDDFLGDLDKKFSSISNEILTRLDDMAERCDRLEQEMLLREQSAVVGKSGVGGGGGGSGKEEAG
jgi:hypothetical protein